ncbi:MAG: aminotransferase class V-fold PLP-dependent enzyme [Acidobacteriota bacterium]|nr:aminotransferase class V-fold PLP-dependent enzyme [Acidobacteriota bacterium]
MNTVEDCRFRFRIRTPHVSLRSTMINWADIRKQFPVTGNSTYLNTAAAGPLSQRTSDAASDYYQKMMNDGDIHWNEWLLKRQEVRRKVANFINAEPDEIALTTNTSSGMNIIVDALETRGEVISCDLEFPVTTLPWMHRRIPVHLVKSVSGEVRLEDIRGAMNSSTGVISLSHVQFSNGFRSDLEALGNEKNEHAFVVNASQSAGVFEIDVKRMKIDALCATGHKWMLSGYGSGFVYLSRELVEHSRPRAMGWLSLKEPYEMKNDELHLRHDAAARAELGCPHFAGMFALGASIDLLAEVGQKNIEERALTLNRFLTSRLIDSGWKVLSPIDNDNTRSAETLVAAGEPACLVAKLAEQKIVVTEKPQGIRVATDFFNNEGDIETLIDALGQQN